MCPDFVQCRMIRGQNVILCTKIGLGQTLDNDQNFIPWSLVITKFLTNYGQTLYMDSQWTNLVHGRSVDKLFTQTYFGQFLDFVACPLLAHCPTPIQSMDKHWTNFGHGRTLDIIWTLLPAHCLPITTVWQTLDKVRIPLDVKIAYDMPIARPWPRHGPLKAQRWPT